MSVASLALTASAVCRCVALRISRISSSDRKPERSSSKSWKMSDTFSSFSMLTKLNSPRMNSYNGTQAGGVWVRRGIIFTQEGKEN